MKKRGKRKRREEDEWNVLCVRLCVYFCCFCFLCFMCVCALCGLYLYFGSFLCCVFCVVRFYVRFVCFVMCVCVCIFPADEPAKPHDGQPPRSRCALHLAHCGYTRHVPALATRLRTLCSVYDFIPFQQ